MTVSSKYFSLASWKAIRRYSLLAGMAIGIFIYSDLSAEEVGAEKKDDAVVALEKKATELVKKLGSEKYGTRFLAYESLFKMGRPALGALAKGYSSEDPEIKTRAAELLIALRGRGFLGIQLQEEWDGIRPQDYLRLDANGERIPVAEVDEEDSDGIRSDAPPRVKVIRAVAGMPAEKAGITGGDLVLSVDGQTIKGTLDLMRVVVMAGPGKTVKVVVLREDKKLTLAVELARNPQDPIPPINLMKPKKEVLINLPQIKK